MTTTAVPGLFELGPEARRQLADGVSAYGFFSFGPNALRDDLLALLAAEAAANRQDAWESGSRDADSTQYVHRANLGPVALAVIAAPETARLIRDVTGLLVRPSFEASCFTYYESPQHFLGLHHDRPDACLVTLIVYLDAAWPDGDDPGAGLGLFVFAPGAQPGAEAQLHVTARPNRAVIGLGSQYPHARPHLRPGERVVALTACFAAHESVTETAGPPAAAAEFVAARIEQGMREWREGTFTEARRLFDEALRVDPTAGGAWSGLGSVCWSEGDLAAALAAFTEAARHDCAEPSHWSNIGLCLRDLGRYDGALGVFGVALMLDPAYAAAWNEWANVLQDQQRVEESLPYYFRALALDPSRAVVHHNLGVAYARLRNHDAAYRSFRHALKRDAGYAPSLEEIAVLLAGAGHSEAAREALESAGTTRARQLMEELGLVRT